MSPCKLVSVPYTPARERRGGRWNIQVWPSDCPLSDPELLCYLEDGLLDPEGGQQNWWRTLSSLPRWAKKKRERERERNRITREQHLGELSYNI